MTLALYELSSQFRLLKIQVTIVLEKAGQLPDFKGSMLHGWFGRALKGGGGNAYNVLFGSHAPNQPKPYVICPSEDHKTDYKKGEMYTFEVMLFGDAVVLADKVVASMKYGETLGLGHQRLRFKVVSIGSMTPTGVKSGVHIHRLQDWVHDITLNPEHTHEVALQFVTPMRCKYKGEIIKQPVSDLNFWVNQTLRRLTQLTRFWVNDSQALIDDVYAQQLPTHVDESESYGYYEDWQRYSLKQKEQLPFGGVKGQVSFYGQLGLAPILLKIAEVIHIGGKTTFGLGKVKTAI
jgi:hypothetical protein